jgi:hypothetical protein
VSQGRSLETLNVLFTSLVVFITTLTARFLTLGAGVVGVAGDGKVRTAILQGDKGIYRPDAQQFDRNWSNCH